MVQETQSAHLQAVAFTPPTQEQRAEIERDLEYLLGRVWARCSETKEVVQEEQQEARRIELVRSVTNHHEGRVDEHLSTLDSASLRRLARRLTL